MTSYKSSQVSFKYIAQYHKFASGQVLKCKRLYICCQKLATMSLGHFCLGVGGPTSICITSPETPFIMKWPVTPPPVMMLYINRTLLAFITSHFLPLLPSPPTVFRRLSARPPSLLLPRWKVSHPEPHPRWPCWAQAPPCWPGTEAHTWRVLRTRPQRLALPACRMTSVGSPRRQPRY